MYTGAIPQDHVETTERSFADLDLSDDVLDVLEDLGFEHPTPIQAGLIPDALAGKDVIGLAETGSGKTAAFVLPVIEFIYEGPGPGALILSPTREIALQTRSVLDKVGGDAYGVRTACLIGGVKYGPQLTDLKNRPEVVVATPGRLLDHLERRNLSLDSLSCLVIDEADHMLDLGFLPQIQRILEQCPRDRQTLMLSATMPELVERLVHRFMRDPVRHDFRPDGRAARGIDHRLYLVEPSDKKACAMALLRQVSGSTLVFTRRKIDAEWLSKALEKEEFEVDRIHGDLSQSQRVSALDGLREGDHRILVATDVAARGIDIPRIEHIINFDMPQTVEDYIHRAGRTARGASKGTVSSIGTWKEKRFIREVEDALGEEIPQCEVPGVDAYEPIQPRRNFGSLKRGSKPIRRRRF